MKEWWKLPSYKVYRVDSEYTEYPSVRVTWYSLTGDTAIEVYWLDGTPEPETTHDSNGT